MTEQEIREVVHRCLKTIAPEARLETVDPDVDFREELDLDSMDFMNFVVALHETLKVDIPEIEYPRYFTLSGCYRELEKKLAR